jgi:23S rRNA (cytidine1920-2'-O)/16S rRNA (cytidine1409-2'-O)-methyltransferase
LQHGAAKVIAVDVGTEQLHQRLRSDSRVELHEKTDIRTFKTSTRFNLVVADLSFISLDDVLDILLNHASEHTDFFLLLKPQFEVGKGNTKKGIVKREELVTEVMRNYTSYLESKGVSSLTLFPCSIKGGDGNQEYFIFFSL